MTLNSNIQKKIKNIKKQGTQERLKTNFFIEKLLVFLEVGLNYLDSELSDQKEVIVDCLLLIVEYIESYNNNPIKKQELKENLFNNLSLRRILIDNFTNPQTYTDNDEILIGLISVTNCIVEGRNLDIQKKLYADLSVTPKSELLVAKINTVIQAEVTKLSSLMENNKLFVMLNEVAFSYEDKDSHLLIHCLSLIQWLNDEHYSDFQEIRKKNQIKLIQSSFLENVSHIVSILDRQRFKGDERFYHKLATFNMKSNEEELKSFKYMGIFLHNLHSQILEESEVTTLKNFFFEIIEHLIENDEKSLIRKKIVRVFSFNNLYLTLIQIYNSYMQRFKGEYQLDTVQYIEYGFQIFFLLRDLEETNKRMLKAQILFKKATTFNPNWEHLQEQKQDINELKDLFDFQKAYQFFQRNTGWIEIVNSQGDLQEVFFQILPHLNQKCLTQEIMEDFESKIDRSSAQAKHQSLMQISRRFNEKLLSERRIQDKAAKNRVLSFIMFLSQHQPELRALNWFTTVLENAQLIYLYRINPITYQEKQERYASKIADQTSISITLYFQILVCVILFVFFLIQNWKYIDWIIEQELNLLEKKHIQEVQEAKTLKSKGIMNIPRISIIYIERIKVYLKHWLSNTSVAYFFSYMPVLLLSAFVHEFFIPLLLLDVFFRFPETQNVFKAFWNPRKRLFYNIVLYMIFMYFFAIIAFLTLQEYFEGLCDNLYSCFSVIFDNAQKLLSVRDSHKYGYQLDIEDLFDFGFMLIVVSCIWTWTFTSLIIESYANLRKKDNEKLNDKINICYICALNRERIQKICAYGYDKHVKNWHNSWTYLKYMASLHFKPSEQFTGTEKYIYECIQNNDTQWFPEGRSSDFKKP